MKIVDFVSAHFDNFDKMSQLKGQIEVERRRHAIELFDRTL